MMSGQPIRRLGRRRPAVDAQGTDAAKSALKGVAQGTADSRAGRFDTWETTKIEVRTPLIKAIDLTVPVSRTADAKVIRKYWAGLKGRTALNINWDAVSADSTVYVTASEYIASTANPEGAQRFVGSASIVVRNISPHGPPYDNNRGVGFVVDVQWPTPLNVVTDIVILTTSPRSQPPTLTWRRTGLVVQHQQQTNWCWNAVSVSIAGFYAGTAPSQCAFANTTLGRTDCCGAGGPTACNQAHSTGDALASLGHLASRRQGTAAMAAARQEIGAGRPIAVRVAWSGGGAHALAITGALDQDEFVAVDDPWFGPSDIRLSTLNGAYQGTGSVTHLYLTQ